LLHTDKINSLNTFNPNRRSSIFLRLFLLTVLSVWILGFIQLPFISQQNSLIHYLLSRIYSVVCHQETGKCFIIADRSMLVCARCTGIYLGSLIIGLITFNYKIPIIGMNVLLLALVPLFLDVLFTGFGIHTYSKFVALSTGLIFGSVIYLILINEFENYFSIKSIKRNE